jgi:hypothetical protein
MQARIRQMSLFAVLGFALVVLLGGTALAQSSNSEVGTWKLNVAKSKFAGRPAPKSMSIKIEAAGVGIKTIVDGVDADGTVSRLWATAHKVIRSLALVSTQRRQKRSTKGAGKLRARTQRSSPTTEKRGQTRPKSRMPWGTLSTK